MEEAISELFRRQVYTHQDAGRLVASPASLSV